MRKGMAGDRGLAFVVIGMIGISAFWISNQWHIRPLPQRARSTATAAVSDSAAVFSVSQEVQSSFDTSETAYLFPTHEAVRDRTREAIFPKLSGWPAGHLAHIRPRLQLAHDSGLPPPID